MTMQIIPASHEGMDKIAADTKAEDRRLVVLQCPAPAEDYALTYPFVTPNYLVHYRLAVQDRIVSQLTQESYGGAFVYENEIHDLYGFTFTGMTLDFGGTFIRTKIQYPFKKEKPAPTVTKVTKEGAS